MRHVLLVVLLLAACVSLPPARSFAAGGCAPNGSPAPAEAGMREVSDLDWDGQPDALWIGQFRDGSGRTDRVVGVTTASGDNSHVQVTSARPIPLSSFVIDAQQDGQHQISKDGVQQP